MFELMGKELLGAIFVTLVSLVYLRFLAPTIGLLDQPGHRKTHVQHTPLIGGVSIYLGLLSLGLTNQPLYAEYMAVINVSFIMLLVGILDDAFELTTQMRLLFQLVGGVVVYLSGLHFVSLGDLVFTGPVNLGFLALPFTLIAVVGGANAINMIDGLDGLAGGLVLVALVFLGVFAYAAGGQQILVFIAVLFSAVVIFLLFNYRFPWNDKASVFLGDGGAYALGFLLACLFLKATQGEEAFVTPILMLWILAIPLLDIAGVIWRRLRRGHMPVKADRDHIHHLLLDRGMSENGVVWTLHTAALLFAATGALGHFYGISDGTMFIGFLALCAAYFTMTKVFKSELPYSEDITR